MWHNAATFIKITGPSDSKRDSLVSLLGMKKPIYYWAMKKAVHSHGETANDKTRQEAEVAIRLSATNIPDILIRCHNERRWFGDLVIQLPILHRNTVKEHFRKNIAVATIP